MEVTASNAASLPNRLRAARIRRAHGVRGELRVEALGGDASRFAAGLRLWEERGQRWLTVRSARSLGGSDVGLTLVEVPTRAAAEELHGAYLAVDTADARPLPHGEWFVEELRGCRAQTPAGEPLGVVIDVEDYPAHDILVVRATDGVERRFPMVGAFVADVDVQRRLVVITPWEEDA